MLQYKRGDHLYVNHKFYNHHGIYVGNNKVIHYLSKGISLTDMETFGRGYPVKIKQHIFQKDKNEIVSRAYSRLGENRYNLIFNNCEHFATWCCTGVSVSMQVVTTVIQIIIFKGGI